MNARILVAAALLVGACSDPEPAQRTAAPDAGELPTDGPGDAPVADLPPDPGSDSPGDAGDVRDDEDPGQADVEQDLHPWLPPDASFSTRYAAGAARRLVNPHRSLVMGGFGFCGGSAELCRWSEGIHDDLSASAAAIADTETGEVVIFVGVDSLGLLRFDLDMVHDQVERAMLDRYGVHFRGERLIVAASHSHGTPDSAGIFGAYPENGRDEEYMAYLRGQIVGAGVEAFGRLDDAELVEPAFMTRLEELLAGTH